VLVFVAVAEGRVVCVGVETNAGEEVQEARIIASQMNNPE
jgi:hypothetical protein